MWYHGRQSVNIINNLRNQRLPNKFVSNENFPLKEHIFAVHYDGFAKIWNRSNMKLLFDEILTHDMEISQNQDEEKLQKRSKRKKIFTALEFRQPDLLTERFDGS